MIENTGYSLVSFFLAESDFIVVDFCVKGENLFSLLVSSLKNNVYDNYFQRFDFVIFQ
jgi:hypothetical protein